MRRRFAILFAFVSICGAAACGGGAEEEPVEEPHGPVQEPDPPEPTQVEPMDGIVGENIYG